MSIELKITGESAAEIAQNLITFAFMLAPQMRDKAPRQSVPDERPAVEAEPVEEPKKPRGRSRKAEVIEHDANEGAKEDVHGAEAGSDGDAAVSGGGAERAQPEREAEVPAEAPVEAAPAAEEAPSDETPVMSIDELRKYTLSSYLLEHFKSLDDQKAEFGKLLAEFEVTKIGDLPAEKINAFKALVDAKIAAAKGA